MKTQLFQVDAFTSRIFGGNPAAVCFFGQWPEDKLLQKIAMENNLSETAFLVKKGPGYELRWFTPVREVDLCGHATLASAHIIFTRFLKKETKIQFETRYHGTLLARKTNQMIELEFPSTMPEKISTPDILVEALGKEPLETFESRDLMAVFEDEETVSTLQPDFSLIKKLKQLGVIITAPGNQVDVVSRFFAPNVGIEEDPVTGSAHTTLVPYWAEKLGKNELRCKQLSKRGGELHCILDNQTVYISGHAVTYLEGSINYQDSGF